MDRQRFCFTVGMQIRNTASDLQRKWIPELERCGSVRQNSVQSVSIIECLYTVGTDTTSRSFFDATRRSQLPLLNESKSKTIKQSIFGRTIRSRAFAPFAKVRIFHGQETFIIRIHWLCTSSSINRVGQQPSGWDCRLCRSGCH